MDGGSGGPSPPIRIVEGEERKGTLIAIKEKCFNPTLAFFLHLYFHICSGNMNI